MFEAIRDFLEGEENRTIDYIPSTKFDDWIPKAEYTASVTQQGQVIVPAEERDQEYGTDIQPGDHYHVHLFPPSLEEERVKDYIRFDAQVTQNNYITIPKEQRDQYDIRPDDGVAVHLYWTDNGD
ncbi:MAG: hypothetical protein SVU32_08590 [Candidatus Nanohaloarchaea archaeon]|nr:hypothetical protein [Candidatus Nanohaloarchaea archaeon]